MIIASKVWLTNIILLLNSGYNYMYTKFPVCSYFEVSNVSLTIMAVQLTDSYFQENCVTVYPLAATAIKYGMAYQCCVVVL